MSASVLVDVVDYPMPLRGIVDCILIAIVIHVVVVGSPMPSTFGPTAEVTVQRAIVGMVIDAVSVII